MVGAEGKSGEERRGAPGAEGGETEATIPLLGKREARSSARFPAPCVLATPGDAVIHFALHYIALGQRAVYGWHPRAPVSMVVHGLMTGVPRSRFLGQPGRPRRSLRTCVHDFSFLS